MPRPWRRRPRYVAYICAVADVDAPWRWPFVVALPVKALMTPGQPLALPPEAEAQGRGLLLEGLALSPAPAPLWSWFWPEEPARWRCWTEWRRLDG